MEKCTLIPFSPNESDYRYDMEKSDDDNSEDEPKSDMFQPPPVKKFKPISVNFNFCNGYLFS